MSEGKKRANFVWYLRQSPYDHSQQCLHASVSQLVEIDLRNLPNGEKGLENDYMGVLGKTEA